MGIVDWFLATSRTFISGGRSDDLSPLRFDSGSRLLDKYRARAEEVYRTEQDKLKSVITAVWLTFKTTAFPDNPSRVEFLRRNIVQLCAPSLHTEDIPLALFYKDKNGNNPFSLQSESLYQFTGLTAAPGGKGSQVLLDLIRLEMLRKELDKAPQPGKRLGSFATVDLAEVGWALGQIGETRAIPLLREWIRQKGRIDTTLRLIYLCKLGCAEEIEELRSILALKPANQLAGAGEKSDEHSTLVDRIIVELSRNFFCPHQIVNEIRQIADSGKISALTSNAQRLLREFGNPPIPGSAAKTPCGSGAPSNSAG
jgi:hypothetical protein